MLQGIRWFITVLPIVLIGWGGYRIYESWKPLYTQRVVWGVILITVFLVGIYALRQWLEYKRTSAMWHHRTHQGQKLVAPAPGLRQIGPPPQTPRGAMVAPIRPPNQEAIFVDLPTERYELDVTYE